ncbi:MAG TPA: DMT family transporter [Actinomycetota bacterium]|nr:DMT family transporter [Actinomycetota bacterium]
MARSDGSPGTGGLVHRANMRRMAFVLGLAAALTYGAADFVGGLASRKAPVLSVVLLSQVAGTGLLLAALPFFLDPGPTTESLAWGAASGAAGAAGVLFLYKGLASGSMSVVAPITAVEAAGVPVLWGLATGERPAPVAVAGVVVALVAVVLVSGYEPAGRSETRTPFLRRPGVTDALIAGASFGFFFILLDKTGDDAGLWPLVGARAASLSLLTALVLSRRHRPAATPGARSAIVAAGVLDVAANLLYLLSTREGLLSIVAVLTSLYPASTVLLARVFLDERIGRLQMAGLGAAVAGVVMMAAG